MKLIKVKNYNELSEKASEIVIKEIKKNPKIAIAFATGKSPLGLYKNLVKANKKGKVNFSKIKAFNLDEYYKTNIFSKYLYKNLFNKINIRKENICLLNGKAKNPKKECRDYERKIKKAGIGLMILGLGENGHIAFNEPGSLKNSKTRLVRLKHKALKKQALTIGISTIMRAGKILLLVSGDKAEAIKCLMKCKPNSCCPATFLKSHKNLTIIVLSNLLKN